MSNTTYTIIIKNETDRSAGQSVGGVGGIGNNPNMTMPTQSSSSSSSDGVNKVSRALMQKAVGLVSVSAIASVVDRVWTHENSLVEVRTGSRELQERTTYNYNLTKSRIYSGVGGAIAGAQIGSNLGPVGTAAGAAIGAVVGLLANDINRQIDISFFNDTKLANYRLESMQRNAAAQRTTISGSRYMNATQM